MFNEFIIKGGLILKDGETYTLFVNKSIKEDIYDKFYSYIIRCIQYLDIGIWYKSEIFDIEFFIMKNHINIPVEMENIMRLHI